MKVSTRFNMYCYIISACFCKSFNIMIRVFNHQMNIKRQLCNWTNRFNNKRPNRNVWYKVAIHYINVQHSRAALCHRLDLIRQVGKIRRQYGRR